MTKYVQTKEDLLCHLKDQITFIITSALAYDSGFKGESKRLAVALRILLHDTKSSISLLAQLGKLGKKEALFYNTASPYDYKNLATSNCLTMIKISSGEVEYIAPLDNLPPDKRRNKKVGFSRWWQREIIFRDNVKNEFTRKQIVLTVADKEGGAHIDPALDAPYAALSKFNSLGWKVITTDGTKDPKDNPVLPSIRQIAHEVIKSLRDEATVLFPPDDSVWITFSKYDEHCRTV